MRKANEEGYSDLLLSMEDEVAFGIVNEAKSADLPSGDLTMAWKNLLNKYAPSTKDELVSVKKEFMQCVMESGDDPEEYITRLESINRRIKNIDPTKANSEEDLLIHAMASLPSEYDHLVPHLEEDLSDMTVEKLKQKLRPVN